MDEKRLRLLDRRRQRGDLFASDAFRIGMVKLGRHQELNLKIGDQVALIVGSGAESATERRATVTATTANGMSGRVIYVHVTYLDGASPSSATNVLVEHARLIRPIRFFPPRLAALARAALGPHAQRVLSFLWSSREDLGDGSSKQLLLLNVMSQVWTTGRVSAPEFVLSDQRDSQSVEVSEPRRMAAFAAAVLLTAHVQEYAWQVGLSGQLCSFLGVESGKNWARACARAGTEGFFSSYPKMIQAAVRVARLGRNWRIKGLGTEIGACIAACKAANDSGGPPLSAAETAQARLILQLSRASLTRDQFAEVLFGDALVGRQAVSDLFELLRRVFPTELPVEIAALRVQGHDRRERFRAFCSFLGGLVTRERPELQRDTAWLALLGVYDVVQTVLAPRDRGWFFGGVLVQQELQRIHADKGTVVSAPLAALDYRSEQFSGALAERVRERLAREPEVPMTNSNGLSGGREAWTQTAEFLLDLLYQSWNENRVERRPMRHAVEALAEARMCPEAPNLVRDPATQAREQARRQDARRRIAEALDDLEGRRWIAFVEGGPEDERVELIELREATLRQFRERAAGRLVGFPRSPEPSGLPAGPQVSVDDIESFAQVKTVSRRSIGHLLHKGRVEMAEDDVQRGLEQILGEQFHKEDHGGET